MKKPADPVRFRESLFQLLEASPRDEGRLLRQFEAQRQAGQPFYSATLYLLTHLSFSEAEAGRHWQRIQAHRRHLRGRLGRDVGLRVALLDYFVNVSRELKNPKVIEISIYERTERNAVTDGLTGLFNHTYFVQALRREVQRCKRHDLRVSLVMFDLDDFKRFNDARGHVEGDRALMKVAGLMTETLREIDIAARYGGEEFAVVLPDTSRTGAFIVADRIRARVEGHFRRRRGSPPITISGGVATYPEDAGTAEELVRRADEGLYRSKAAGKNRITLVRGEKRRFPRVAVAHPVTVQLPGGRSAAGRTRNMSEGGLLVSLRQPPPVGAPLSVVIRPSHTAPIELQGRVVRVEKLGGPASRLFYVGVRLESALSPTRSLMVLRRVEAAVGAG